MAGFAHTGTPIQEDHMFLGSLVPVVVEDHLTAGFTYRINEHHEVHLVGIHAFENSLTDTGDGDLFSQLAKHSRVTGSAESAALGYTYKF
jgi:long-chain fatty acid transport protein